MNAGICNYAYIFLNTTFYMHRYNHFYINRMGNLKYTHALNIVYSAVENLQDSDILCLLGVA